MYLPGAQRLQASAWLAAIADEKVPLGQSIHVAEDTAPVVVAYFPGGQEKQPDDVPFLRSCFVHLPGGQYVHVVDAASLYFPLLHSTHFAGDISVFKYSPAKH